MTALPPALTGAVYDRGYRPYQGPRGGRREATLALWRLSVRRALGLRRSWRQKVFPWSLLGLATIPAVVNVGVAWVIRNNPIEMEDFAFITYREYVGVSTMLLLFVALTAPDVVCPDRAQRVLPPAVLPAAHRRRLRRGQGGRPSPPSCSASRSCPRSCCSSARCW